MKDEPRTNDGLTPPSKPLAFYVHTSLLRNKSYEKEFLRLPPEVSAQIVKNEQSLMEFLVQFVSAIRVKEAVTSTINRDELLIKSVEGHDAAHFPRSTKSEQPSSFRKGLARFWELFPFLLSPKARREVYEPAYNDFLQDFLIARRFKTKKARQWVNFCFFCKTCFMVADCFRVMFTSKIGQFLLGAVPESIRRFLRS